MKARSIKVGLWHGFKAARMRAGVPVVVDARRRTVDYVADLWEGPLHSGEAGKRIPTQCSDILLDYGDGERVFMNTAPSCSFYTQLMGAALA